MRVKPPACVLALCLVVVAAACGKRQPPEKPFATPEVTLSRDSAPLGAPIDIKYQFTVAPDAQPLKEDLRVFVGVVDTDEELMWTDDHNPPIPTSQWKPGQTITYTRTVFVPVYPYVGEASIHMGLYSPATNHRVTLSGEDVGQHAYKVARLQIEPQTANLPLVFKDGWHSAEVAEHNSTVEWQWTKRDATIAFKNPKKDCLFYLDADNPGTAFHEPQHVQVSLTDGPVVDDFTIEPGQQPVMRKIRLTAAQLGTAEMAELHITVDKTFVPALINAGGSKDARELGIRVFHAYVDAR
jgi:hypothetical protein